MPPTRMKSFSRQALIVEDSLALIVPLLFVVGGHVLQDRLANNEDHEREQVPFLEEGATGHPAPHKVREQHDHGVADDIWIPRVRKAL